MPVGDRRYLLTAVSRPTGEARRRPSRPEAVDAAEAIVARRARNSEERLPDPDDLLGVVRYVANHHDPRLVDAEVIRADVAGVATIVAFLAGEVDRLHLAVLEAGLEDGGMNYSGLAAAEGLPGRQHAHDLVLRLTAAAAGGVKRGQLVRAGRRSAAAERTELERHAVRLRALAEALVRRRDRLPDDLGDAAGVDVDDWCGEVAGLERGTALPHLVVVELRLVVGELSAREGLDAELGAIVVDGAQLLAVADL